MEGKDGQGKVRLRRTKSVSVAQVDGESRKEDRLRSVQPDKPVHKCRDSLFSSSSGYTNYRGFLNLCIILLVLSNARLVLENIIKYGILIDPVQWIIFFIPSISLGIEKLLAKGLIGENFGLFCITTLVSAEILCPPIVIYNTNCHAVAASIVMGYVSIVSLKLVSYHMVNYWCRTNNLDPPKRRRSVSSERDRHRDAPKVDNDIIKQTL
ncbi:diacylglycerol O-acyltransferase 1 [Caerostris extrusa]|uniref:diacylglycerol O-acyltransferase n=1 Tax=Caerostris extrusa TaxID=172846 RepID=A0AAV4QA80_CAEEX|nr:diacylglycerol O-acyltransferase 1 [Caerostris extrusa]